MASGGHTGLSAGVHLAPWGTGALAYDTVTETAHLIDADTRAILTGETTDDRGTGTSSPSAKRHREIRALGLTGRTKRPEPIEPVRLPRSDPDSGDVVGATHVLFDLRYAFAGPDAQLIETLDAFLGSPVDEPAATVFRVVPDPSGIDLHVDTHWRFPDHDRLLHQLPTALNRIAARSDRHPVLHAAGVRTPGGRILLVTGEPNAGKSTLTAHLVRAGCDYLGDESVAILPDGRVLTNPKPLTLDRSWLDLHLDAAGSSAPIGGHVLPTTLRADAVTVIGPVGPIHAIIETRYDSHHTGSPDLEELDADRAIRRVLANTLNLARSGERGLRILADLAWQTPVATAVHGDGEQLAHLLIDTADS